jgi:3-deoxy-manno-octulosonate cytidylyltransferase (CMP-KDO synthetase)
MGGDRVKIIGVIPARYDSTRFPGKPLADICGKPMLWWVYSQAKKSGKLLKVVVATDDDRILNVCKKLNVPVILTGQHPTAIHRLWEVSKIEDADFYVQINGDEPLIKPDIIDAVIPDFIPNDIEYATNVITNTEDAAQVMDSSNIKIVFDSNMRALYMSRTPIPYPFKTIGFKYHKHVGVIGFNKKMLNFYVNTEPGQFESIEGLDLMRPIEYGKTLQLVYVPNCETLSVDTPQDLEQICNMYPPPPPPRYRSSRWLKRSSGSPSSFSKRRAA